MTHLGKKMALAIINLFIGDSLVVHIINVIEPLVYWKLLYNITCSRKQQHDKENSFEKQISFHLEEDKLISDYLN